MLSDLHKACDLFWFVEAGKRSKTLPAEMKQETQEKAMQRLLKGKSESQSNRNWYRFQKATGIEI